MWWQFIVEEGLGPNCKMVAQLFDKDTTGQDDPLGRYSELHKIQKKENATIQL